MKRVAWFVVLIGLFPSLLICCGDSFSGKCIGVSDGDTIKVMYSGKSERIRLYGVDSPEKGQDFWRSAKQFTSEMVFGKTVEVRPIDRDRYGRTVAWVSVNGKSLNRELVAAGLAWWYKHYAPKEKDLRDLELKARKEKVGIWSRPDPIPPWEFRR